MAQNLKIIGKTRIMRRIRFLCIDAFIWIRHLTTGGKPKQWIKEHSKKQMNYGIK